MAICFVHSTLLLRFIYVDRWSSNRLILTTIDYSVVLAYSWKNLTFLGGKESAPLRNLHYFIFFWIKQPVIKERNSFWNAHDIVSRCVISRYTLARYRRAQATVQEQMPESLGDIPDSMKILALWTTLMSSFMVHCGVCYFTSRGSIWAISTGFTFLG